MTPLRAAVLAVVAAATMAFQPAAFAQAPPIRIMPLGDSITDGSSFDDPNGTGGYRGPLYAALTSAGYNVDYIGTSTNNSSLVPDQNHEGHGGWKIGQIDSNIAGWFSTLADPDVILLHIGTNDSGQADFATAIDRLDALILKMATLRPFAHIIVTNLMERGEPNNSNIQTLFNPHVQDRVNAHAAAGRRVTFLDMRAAVPLADMPDNLHPDQTGYNKMAAAWLPAIQAVIGPLGDDLPPGISRARGTTDHTHVEVIFSKPVADSAANLTNFALSGGLTISDAVLDSSKRVVTLTTSEQVIGGSYTVTVNNVVDRTAGALALPADSTADFNTATPRGYLNNVPESSGYTLACSLEIPNLASYGNTAVAYTIDNRSRIGPFSRVAYYLELQTPNGDLQYAWASMDAFTTDINRIAVPSLASGATFQQAVTNLNVVSNVAGLTTGTGFSGQLEFWPTSYNQTNSAGVPGASGTLYDIGDNPTPGGYGSMQVHNVGAAQTVFAFNNWGNSGGTGQSNVDLGIGNNPSAGSTGVDWTFANNAGNFAIKTLQVLVQTTTDTTPPTIAAAAATFGRTQVIVRFSEPLAPATVLASNFALDGGVEILGLTLAANQREVVLTTTTQPTGTPLSLTVSNLRDSSAGANRIAPGSTIAVAAPALPPEIAANVGAAADGYQLVASIEIPVTGNFNSSNTAYLVDDRAAIGTFARVAYYMETQKTGQAAQWVWTSMDAFTPNRRKLCIPTTASGAVFQRNVTNLDVLSNVTGIVTGSTATGGNIEFWPTDYSAANALSIPNASATTHDTGDTRSTTGSYGSMQVHNHDTGANQTLFAINRFGGDGLILDVGIGNNPNAGNTGSGGSTQGSDWTFSSSAPSYHRRILHVLVLPGSTTDPAIVAKAPEATAYQLVYSLNIPATGNLVSGTGFTDYAVNLSADVAGFSRVAYYMELQKTGDPEPRFVWASMDAFTTSIGRIGVPTPASGAVFQQPVTNMNVFSNVPGVATGTGITTGNIEFWPTNYSNPITSGILPGNVGSSAIYDFNDTRSSSGSHGSMQVHNYGAGQTLFAINNWGTSGNSTNSLGMGIGNHPTPSANNSGPQLDWTFAANGASWDLRRLLHVYVLPAPADTTGPVPVLARPSTSLGGLVVVFDEAVAESAANPANFNIPGLTVTAATLVDGNKEVALTTSPQTPGSAYTVNISGVRDRSPAGNSCLPGAAVGFTAYTPPAILANVPETSGYQLVYQLALPSATPRWNLNAVPYSIDESRFGEWTFDRVAYLLELDGNWAYASFDRHTHLLSKIGIPTLGVSPTPFQQIVANMNVASNVPGIVTGDGITTGNIEFWGGNYSVANAINIPNASATSYDFGDTMSTGGHGSFQIHNHGASQVLFAFNNWGANSGQTCALGIGNNPTAGGAGQPSGTQGLDWTFTYSASNYTTRNVYVLARPGGSPGGSAPVLYAHPASRTVDAGGNASLTVAVAGTGPFTYQWRRNGVAIPGQTNPWLELTNLTTADAGNYDVIVASPNSVAATSLAGVVTVNDPSIIHGTITRNPDGSVDGLFHGTSGRSYQIQRSINLEDWTVIDTIMAAGNGTIPFHDGVAPPDSAFYRTREAP